MFGDVPNFGRYNFAMCAWKKNLILFGGEIKYDPNLKQRECIADIRLINPGNLFFLKEETLEWKYIRASGDLGRFIVFILSHAEKEPLMLRCGSVHDADRRDQQ